MKFWPLAPASTPIWLKCRHFTLTSSGGYDAEALLYTYSPFKNVAWHNLWAAHLPFGVKQTAQKVRSLDLWPKKSVIYLSERKLQKIRFFDKVRWLGFCCAAVSNHMSAAKSSQCPLKLGVWSYRLQNSIYLATSPPRAVHKLSCV